eukprot:jgi/Orpsp1_1/1192256/evm.model.d7180000091786.1
MKQQFISKPNKIFRCISNRTTALLYLIFILVIFVFNTIYLSLIYEKKVRFLTYFWHVAIIIDLITEIYEIKIKNKTSSSKHFKAVVIGFATIIYIVIAATFLMNYMKSDSTIMNNYKKSHSDTKLSDSEIVEYVKHKLIVNYSIFTLIVTVYVIGCFLFYYPFNREVRQYKENGAYSRMLEAGEGDKESIH